MTTATLLAIAALWSPAFRQAPQVDMSRMTTYRLVFFTRGESKAQHSQEELQKMQAEHIKNLDLLNEEGKCLLAGPLGSNGAIRGIVLLAIDDKADVMDSFKRDPFVQNGRLVVESYRWMTFKDVVKPHDKPVKMEQYYLGIFKKGPKWQPMESPEMRGLLNAHVGHVMSLVNSGVAALAGPFLDGKEKGGLYIFRLTDEKKLRALVDADPAVKAGQFEIELHPLYMAKGVFKEP